MEQVITLFTKFPPSMYVQNMQVSFDESTRLPHGILYIRTEGLHDLFRILRTASLRDVF